MRGTIWDEVAYLMVEQYENMTENYNPRISRLIRDSAIKGESALYTVCASTFEDRFDEALLGAARAGMDYIAYVDETWEDINGRDRQSAVEAQREHLESVKAVLRFSRMGDCSVTQRIKDAVTEGEQHMRGILLQASGTDHSVINRSQMDLVTEMGRMATQGKCERLKSASASQHSGTFVNEL